MCEHARLCQAFGSAPCQVFPFVDARMGRQSVGADAELLEHGNRAGDTLPGQNVVELFSIEPNGTVQDVLDGSACRFTVVEADDDR